MEEWLTHFPVTEEIAGSNPVASAKYIILCSVVVTRLPVKEVSLVQAQSEEPNNRK